MTRPASDKTRPADGADAWITPGGLVTVSAPVGVSPYYRLEWYTVEGTRERGQTTGGRTFAKAWAKAVKKETELLAGATKKTEMPARVGTAYWLNPNRPTPKGGWDYSQQRNMTYYADNYFLPKFGDVRHMDLRRHHFQECVNEAPTESEGSNIRRAANSLIAALRQGDYLLDSQAIDLSNVWWHGVRQEPVDATGETDEERAGFVPRWRRPSHDRVRALREAAETVGRGIWWRGLMVELAAYSGPRWSELLAFDHGTVHLDNQRIDINHRVAFETGKAPYLKPPKMAKRRTTIFVPTTPTGYDLAGALERRLAEVADEKAAGTNPLGLLFPSRSGMWLRSGNFHRDIFEPAALTAGWEWAWTERANGRGKTRKQRSFTLTWHSLRHTFCTVALEEWELKETTVALLSGHKNANTTKRLYVNPAEDALDEAQASLRQRKEARELEEAQRTLRGR